MISTAPPPKDWNFQNQFAPEADMLQIARHDFSALSSPILVACRDQQQLDEFCFREGLLCAEVRRLAGRMGDLRALREDKILLLLPGWEEDPRTRTLGDHWIFELDRYTVELRRPHPRRRAGKKLLTRALATLATLLALALLWLVADKANGNRATATEIMKNIGKPIAR